MLKCASKCAIYESLHLFFISLVISISEKLSKIKKVERLELEEEQRQADLAAAASAGRGETDPAKT